MENKDEKICPFRMASGCPEVCIKKDCAIFNEASDVCSLSLIGPSLAELQKMKAGMRSAFWLLDEP